MQVGATPDQDCRKDTLRQMQIDELPEDLASRCRLMAQMCGMDADNPDDCHQLLMMLMTLNSDKLPTEREGVDREAADWDSDDPADDNSPCFEVRRQEHHEYKAAALKAAKILDRAYAFKGRGEPIENLEARFDALLRKAAPDESDPPLHMGKHVLPNVKDNLFAPAELCTSFRRSRINDLQLRLALELYREDVRRQMAGEESSTTEGSNGGAEMAVRLIHGPAGLSKSQLEHIHGAFLRVCNVRESVGRGWTPQHDDWSPVEEAVRAELDRPRALPFLEAPDDGSGRSSRFARFDPLSVERHSRARPRAGGDPDTFPSEPLVGKAKAVAESRIWEFGDLIGDRNDELPCFVHACGDLIATACLAGPKGLGASAKWWRIGSREPRRQEENPPATEVSDALCAAGIDALACHSPSQTLWLAGGGRAFGFTATDDSDDSCGYSLQLPHPPRAAVVGGAASSRCLAVGVAADCVLAVAGGQLGSWPLSSLATVDGLGEAEDGSDDGYMDDPCESYRSRADAFDLVPDGAAPSVASLLPAGVGSAQLRASSVEPPMVVLGSGSGDVHLERYSERSSSVLLYDAAAGRVAARLLGHSAPASLSSQAHCAPHTLCSFCVHDGSVNVWDAREGRPTHTVYTSDDRVLHAALAVEVGGAPFLFTGGSDEAVKAWDLRRGGRPLYELTTGNTTVLSLDWHTPSASLLVATQCSYALERAFGRVDGYGWDYDMTTLGENLRGRSFKDMMMHDQLRQRARASLQVARDALPTSGEWPARAMHTPKDFRLDFDARGHALLRYRFERGEPLALPQTGKAASKKRSPVRRFRRPAQP